MMTPTIDSRWLCAATAAAVMSAVSPGSGRPDAFGEHEHHDDRVAVVLDQMSHPMHHSSTPPDSAPFNLGRAGAILPGDDN